MTRPSDAELVHLLARAGHMLFHLATQLSAPDLVDGQKLAAECDRAADGFREPPEVAAV